MLGFATLRSKGFALATSLMLLLVVLILGIGFLGKRVSLYKEALAARSAGQARMACLAGMEDCRVKLEKDGRFPPSGGTGQEFFTYSEPLTDVGGAVVGGYRVTLDRRLQLWPYAVLRITSLGWSGPANRPIAQHKIYAELDISYLERGTSTVNKNFYRFINWLDAGPY